MTYEGALELWRKYNQKLLYYQQTFGCELVSFDLPVSEYFARVRQIAHGLGLSPPAQEFSFFDEQLRHETTDVGSPLPNDVDEIYRQLLEASETQRRGGIGGSIQHARRKIELSMVVVIYNMAREAPRTLRSLAAGYQQGINEACYEVIVVDNGSKEPLGEETISGFGPNFRYTYVSDPSPSPAAAVNLGVRLTRASTSASS